MIALLLRNQPRWRMHDDNGADWIMVLLMLLLLAAVVVAVVLLVRGSWSMPAAGRGTPSRAPDARAILQERFARGEIDEEEYRARIRALDETSPGG